MRCLRPVRRALLLAALAGARLSGEELVPDSPSSGRFAGRPLIEVLQELQARGIRILYSSDLVTPEMLVRAEPRATSPRQILDEILAPHGLAAVAGPGESLLVTRAADGVPPGTRYGRLEGVVRGQPDRRALGGSEVAVVGTRISAVSFPDGRFSFQRLPAGSYTLEARAAGFLAQRREAVVLAPDRVTRVSFDLDPVQSAREEVLVTPSLFSIRRDDPETRQLLTRAEIDRSPHLGDDPFRVVSQLPGTTPGDYSAKTNIRGGEENELLVLYDGEEIYNPFHLKNFLSVFTVFDSRAIGGLDFWTGGFPAEYGARMSGVIDLTTSAPSERAKFTLGVSLVGFYGYSEGAFANGRGHYQASARRGFLHYAAELANDTSFDPNYYDYFGKILYQVGNATSLSADVLGASDDIADGQAQDPDHEKEKTSDLYGWVTLRSVVSPRLFVETSASTGRLEGDRRGGFSQIGQDFQVEDVRKTSFYGAKQNWALDLSDSQHLKAGFGVKRLSARYDYDSVRRISPPLVGPPPLTVRDIHLEETGTDFGAYVSDRFRLAPGLTTEVGLRWDRQTWAGSGDFSPRWNLVWGLSEKSSIRLAWGLFQQPQRIDELQVEDGVTGYFPAQRAEHRVVSFDHVLSKGVSFRIEAYQKKLDRIRPRYENLFSKLNSFPEGRIDRAYLAPDRAEADGIELLVRQDGAGKFSWWASYALARAQDEIEGTKYARSWDQRHSLRLNLNYRASEKWNLNAAWIYHTGWPDTGVSAVAVRNPDGTVGVNVSTGPFNGERLPAYHRLDVRASRWFPLGRGRLSAFLEVTNLYNRENLCCVNDFTFQVQPDGRVLTTKTYDSWIRMLPSFGIQWEF